jgi:uncharacterized protein
VIVPDINLLLYATVDSFPAHERARHWWEELLNGEAEIALVAPVAFGYIRVTTNRRVFDPPMSMDEAIVRVEAWLERPAVRFALPGPRHLDHAFRLLREVGTARDLTTDVQLAAFAIEHNGEVHSADTDFARIPGLRWVNPLE